jgi:enamine deaminase RidA (YjgF/YER057c/UK114 family)
VSGDAPRSIAPKGWPRPRGYANGLLVPPGRSLLFVAGMVGWDENEKIVPGGFTPQFERALRNVVAVVEEAGGGAQDVVRMLVFVTDKDEYVASRPALADAWRRVMGKHYPAMALVQVAGLLEDGAKVEIEAVAALAPTSPAP